MTRSAPRPSRARRWLLASAVLGLAASAYATWVHYHLLSDPAYTSYCDVSGTVNCTQAYLSRFGSLAGVPVALLGTLFFTLVLVLLGVSRAAARENVPGYLFAMSTIGLAVVMYLAYGSFVVLKTVCPLCVATYVAVVGLFLISGGAMSFPMSQLPARAARDLRALASSPVALTSALLFLAGAASAVAFFPREVTLAAAGDQPAGAAPAAQSQSASQPLSAQEEAAFERWYMQFPIVDPGVPTDGAAVLIVKFNDYQCPPCRQTYEAYKPILAKYRASHPGKVRFVTKDFPLDPECNFNAPGGTHVAACEAAVAVRLAETRNHREAMEDWLFSNQPIMTPDLVRQGVRQVAGVTDFDAQYARLLQQVKADIASGGALGVRSTPTFFINARMIKGVITPRAVDAAIAYELKHAAAR